ncbi:SusC/RagA family TonB-linked outer membrane protein [Niabella aurantiaca]|uniref:SusC/RagA family TonB-linked outer membrane protein n=1 Tax=Niabella aurantiaca TaxID=379900 RepID=UPI00036CA80E|nr:TonB-dependent receptor [Niabella aurantiaca]
MNQELRMLVYSFFKKWRLISFMRFFSLTLLFLLQCYLKALSQDITVSGTVLDPDHQPVALVTVSEKGTQQKGVSDVNGNFKISVGSVNAVLIFSGVQFIEQEVKLEGRTKLNVILDRKINKLDEVVVIGYGEVRRKDLTGSVGTVNMKDMMKAPVISFEDALGGRVAGVQVTSPDGQPGSAPNIVIRGQSSITQENAPLYVIDGFPIENPDNNAINPEEIESIQVLKDASSAAIYGSRGANGVIIITTKKGKSGAPVVNYDFYTGAQKVIQRVATMNSYEFVKYQLEIDSAYASGIYLTNGKTLEDYRNEPTINWEDLMYQTAPMQNHAVSVRGGANNTKYSLSGSLSSSDGIIIYSGVKRYQGRAAIDQIISKSFKTGVNINYSSTKSYGTPTAVASSNSLMYNIWSRRPTNGTDNLTDLIEGGVDLPTDFRWNPVLSAQNELRDRINTVFSANTYLQYNILRGLIFKATGVYQKSVLEYDIFNNSQTRSGSPLTAAGANGVNGSITYTNLDYFTNENTLTYSKSFNQAHNLNALAGYTLQSTMLHRFGGGAIQVPNESLGLSGLDEGIPFSITAANSKSRLQSFLSRLDYNYKERYYLTASFRADGSSKFRAGGNRWGYFPSAAFSWNISKEAFLKNSATISDAKLRVSYGTIGNNRVSDFAYLSALSLPIVNSYGFNNENPPSKGIIPSEIGNPDLKWETSKELNLGLDLSFFKGRLAMTAEVYRKRTDDLLLQAQLPPSFGYRSAYRNIGSVENKGLELTFNTQNIVSKSFKWETNFNISFNRNKVLALTDNQDSYLTTVSFDTRYNGAPTYITQIGQPIGMFYGYIWEGNYQYADFNETSPGVYTLKPDVPNIAASAVKPGHIKYKDLNGDLIVNDADRTVIGNPNPKFIGGFSNNFNYKNFDLNVFLQFSYGNDIMNTNRLMLEGLIGTVGLNMYDTYSNRWTPENQNNMYYATALGGPRVYSTRTLEDGSYLRLKTISFGYNLPYELISKIRFKKLRIYASAQNLLTWTKYSGSDPEVSTFSSAIVQGFDFSAYPRPKTIVLGLNLTF